MNKTEIERAAIARAVEKLTDPEIIDAVSDWIRAQPADEQIFLLHANQGGIWTVSCNWRSGDYSYAETAALCQSHGVLLIPYTILLIPQGEGGLIIIPDMRMSQAKDWIVL